MKKKAVLPVIGMGMILLSVIVLGCTEEEDEGEGVTIMVAGEEVSLDEVFDDYQMKTVSTGGSTYEGISLSDLINETGFSNPANTQYKISASDGWNQDVTWGDMMNGVLVEEETMTAFPGLPGKYRIRDVVKIEAVDVDTIEVNGHLFTWKQPFHILDETVEMKDQDNNTVEGIYLSDLVNLTALSDQETHTYDLQAADGYNQTVTWEDMKKGILLENEDKCVIAHLSKKFNVSDLIGIEVR
jgi:predicted Zn-dependent protease with MMP-like domain